MKKKIILMGIAAALVATTIIGGALAYFQSDGAKVQQFINTQSLGIALNSEDVQETATIDADNLAPGSEIRKELCVTNTDSITLYARVTIQKYWVSYEREIQYEAYAEKTYLADSEPSTEDPLFYEYKDLWLDANMIQLITNAEENGWIVVSSDEEELVMYYTKPLAEGESSTNFLEALMISADIGNEYSNTGVKLIIKTDAIQSYAASDAMLSEWGIAATLDEDGVIQSIEE